MSLYPAEMQGIVLVVVTHLYLMLRETEEVAEVKQENQHCVHLKDEKPLQDNIRRDGCSMVDEIFPAHKGTKTRHANDCETQGKQ